MQDRRNRPETDLGTEQRERLREESQDFQPDAPNPTPELDSEEAGQRVDVVDDPDQAVATEGGEEDVLDPELAEDIRRAQPNPPMTPGAEVDPASDVDLGYLEDEDRETAWDGESLIAPAAPEPTDPLEEERERRARPGEPTEQLPDQTGNRPPERRRGTEESGA